jgi:hypothetical protein
VFERARDIGVFNPYLLSLHAAASISLHSHVFLKEGCFKRFFRSRQQPPSPPQMLSFGSFVSSLSFSAIVLSIPGTGACAPNTALLTGLIRRSLKTTTEWETKKAELKSRKEKKTVMCVSI